MRSLIDDIEELLALRKGDKYRLMDMRARLETKKRLYISDREFLRDLVKNHLGRVMLSPDPGSHSTKTIPTQATESLVCANCGYKIAIDEIFCINCGAKRVDTDSVPQVVKPAQKLEDYEREYLGRLEKHSKSEGFSISANGELGEKTTRENARGKTISKSITKPEIKSDICSNCGSKIAIDEIFCINCGAKRADTSSTLYAPKPIPQPKPKPKPKPKPTKQKPTKKQVTSVKKSRKEELEEYEKKYLKKVGTTVSKSKSTTVDDKTVDGSKVKKPKLSLCVRCGGVMSKEENFCINCGAKR